MTAASIVNELNSEYIYTLLSFIHITQLKDVLANITNPNVYFRGNLAKKNSVFFCRKNNHQVRYNGSKNETVASPSSNYLKW